MSDRSHAALQAGTGRTPIQRKSALQIRPSNDPFEREADRAADAVTRGHPVTASLSSISRISPPQVQRDGPEKPKTNEEKYAEAGKKIGEAFLETELGKKLKEQALNDPLVKGAIEAGESFIGTLPGKIVTGAAATGAVAALGAAHKDLPLQIPKIPLNIITPGLAMKITYEGPVDDPTKAMITFSYTEQGSKPKTGAKSKSELYRDETARMAQDQAKFRAGMRFASGTPQAMQQAADDEAVRAAAFSGVGRLPGYEGGQPLQGGGQSGSQFQLQTPAIGAGRTRKPLRLLDKELQLKPLEEAGSVAAEKKSEDEPALQRKEAGLQTLPSAPPLVSDVLSAPGSPLDGPTRSFMESRFSADFSSVRIHTDRRAAGSARAINAAAYASGRNIVFGSGAYSPHSEGGRHLLAHELAHVVQQGGASESTQFVQRRGVFESIGVFFGVSEGSFSEPELSAYLTKITKANKIEGDFDSDNKARAIVSRWKGSGKAFNLEPAQKVLLINEMLDGPTLGGDEAAILDLLRFSDVAALRLILGPGGVSVKRLESDLDGDSYKQLQTFFSTRFLGGRDALLKGNVEHIGKAPAAAPTFVPDWPKLKARLDGTPSDRELSEIAAQIFAYDNATRDTALSDCGAARNATEKDFKAALAKFEAESDASKKDVLRDEALTIRKKMNKYDLVIQRVSRDVALTTTDAELAHDTKAPDPSKASDIKAALRPDKQIGSGGVEVTFDASAAGKAKYESSLRAILPDIIQGYHDRLVKGKGPAEHADATKVRSLDTFERMGKFSKDETDKVFGQYYSKASHPELKADTATTRGNIHDAFAQMETEIAAMTPPQRRELARKLIFYFFATDGNFLKINFDLGAAAEFDRRGLPKNAEARIQTKLANEFTNTVAEVTKLNEIDRNWEATAGNGEINMQIFKKDTAEKDRDSLWDMFQTLIHEYIHTLRDGAYDTFADSFGGTSAENNTLIEGVDSLLDEIVWENVVPRVNDPTLRMGVEGPEFAKLPPMKVEPASRRRYPSYTQAIKLMNIVGIRNIYAAYFRGDISKIGG